MKKVDHWFHSWVWAAILNDWLWLTASSLFSHLHPVWQKFYYYGSTFPFLSFVLKKNGAFMQHLMWSHQSLLPGVSLAGSLPTVLTVRRLTRRLCLSEQAGLVGCWLPTSIVPLLWRCDVTEHALIACVCFVTQWLVMHVCCRFPPVNEIPGPSDGSQLQLTCAGNDWPCAAGTLASSEVQEVWCLTKCHISF